MSAASPSLPAGRVTAWAGLGVGLAAFAALVARTSFLIDDAFISFRYAVNWAETGVPTYNPGVEPPVEGYSNFLWVLILRWCHELGLPLETASRAVSIAFGAGTIVLLHRFLDRSLALPPLAVALGTVSLGAFPPFAVWSTGGLETSAFAFFLLAGFVLLVRRGAQGHRGDGLAAGLCGLAVALLRVEGFAWVLGIAGCAWIANALSPEGTGRRRARFAFFFGVYLAGFTAFLLWRRAVYGEWMANTVHAKGGLSAAALVRGLKTSASYLALFVSPLVALAALVLTARGPRRGVALGAGAVLLGFLAYDTVVGGDWMPFFRFLAPATPFVAVLLALLFARLPAAPAALAAAACTGVALLPAFGASLAPRGLREALYFRTFRVGYETEQERWRTGVENVAMFATLGRALRQVATPEDSITFGAIGALGYYSGVRVHDRNGLVDAVVARRSATDAERTAGHDKQVPRAWFLPREPTIFHAVIVPAPIPDERSPGYRQGLRAIVDRVFVQGGEDEAPLRAACLPEVHALRPEEGIPPGSSLMLLRATPDSRRAREFWRSVLGP